MQATGPHRRQAAARTQTGLPFELSRPQRAPNHGPTDAQLLRGGPLAQCADSDEAERDTAPIPFVLLVCILAQRAMEAV